MAAIHNHSYTVGNGHMLGSLQSWRTIQEQRHFYSAFVYNSARAENWFKACLQTYSIIVILFVYIYMLFYVQNLDFACVHNVNGIITDFISNCMSKY